MLSRTIRLSMIMLATATAALASASIAEAGMVHANPVSYTHLTLPTNREV